MSENKEKKPIVTTKHLCYVCCREMAGDILIARDMRVDLSGLQDAVVGFSEEPCDRCKKLMEQGIIFVGIDPEKTDDPNDPYRSGDFSVIKETSKLFEVINEPERTQLLQKRVCFIDYRLGYQLGVFRHTEFMEPTNPDAD